MPRNDNDNKYIKAMCDWGKAIAEWQLRNPDKDWLQELGSVQVEQEGGDRPPLPPPKP